MPVREFMRGGHKQIAEPTVITKHNRPIGMWLPPWQTVSRSHTAECGLNEDHSGKCKRLE